MRGVVILSILICILALAACEPALETRPTSEFEQAPTPSGQQQIQIDPCADVSCEQNMICEEGSCVCDAGMKSCNGACIAQDACCSDADCASGTCQNNTCVLQCDFGEVFEDGECQCAEDRKYCREQDKCIPLDSCCIHAQCDSFERCVPLQTRARLCAEFDGKSTCRMLADIGFDDRITINDKSFIVEGDQWLNDGSVTFSIDNETLTLHKNERKALGNIIFYQEGAEELGGFCKRDDAD